MKKIFNRALLFVAAITCVGFMVSCDDDDLPAMDGLFRPVISDGDNIIHGLDDDNYPYMIINWDNYSSANQYTIKIEANDGSDTREVSTDTTFYRFDRLQYDKEYNISLIAQNTGSGLQSKPFTLTTTTLDYPTMLQSIQTSDIIDIAARVKWSEEAAYDMLKVFEDSKDSLVYEATIDPAAAHEKIVESLKPRTTYRVEAYQNGEYKGKRRFTTAASEKFDGEVVDLRGLDADKAYKWFSVGSGSGFANTLDSLIKTEYQDKDLTIVLEGGTTYRITTIELPSTTGTITFVTGLSLAGEAKLGVEGNFRVAADSYVGGVVFDNCVIDSISGYGLTNADNAKADIQNVTITNTSVSNAEKICVGTKGLQPNSLVVENCTFVYTVADAKPFFDFNNKNWEAFKDKFVFKNCIIGQCGRNKETLATSGITGWSGSIQPECQDIYVTSDVIWTPMSEEDPSPKAAFPCTTLSTNTPQTFKAPLQSDFTIITNELGGTKATPGDPRWY